MFWSFTGTVDQWGRPAPVELFKHCRKQMGRDIYHLILLSLVDDLHLSGLHVVQSAKTWREKDTRPHLLQAVNILCFTFLSQEKVSNWICCKSVKGSTKSLLWFLQQKQTNQGNTACDSFTFLLHKLIFTSGDRRKDIFTLMNNEADWEESNDLSDLPHVHQTLFEASGHSPLMFSIIVSWYLTLVVREPSCTAPHNKWDH